MDLSSVTKKASTPLPFQVEKAVNKEEIDVEMPEQKDDGTMSKASTRPPTRPGVENDRCMQANARTSFISGQREYVSWISGFLVNHIKRVYAIVRAGCTDIMAHCTAAGIKMEEQQKRCYEYSKKALAFEGCTLAAYFLSPVPSSSTAGRTTVTFFVTMAALLLAMITDIISLKTKPKWGRALVYLSSLLQTLTMFLVFISLDKAYGYAFILVPVLIFVSIVIALHGVDKAADDDGDHLDRIFDFSALILNWGALITAILCYSMEATDSAASITGYLFIFTVILSLYLMMVTTLRDVALTLVATYLDYSLAALLLGTLIATIISFITGKKT